MSSASTFALQAPLHTSGDTFHVVSEVGIALLAVVVGIVVVVGAFTLFHEWFAAAR
jgi:hypothetical protein